MKKNIERNNKLSYKVFHDYLNDNDTNIICPICNQKPIFEEKKDVYGKINRAFVSCKCGYIINGEIFL